MAKDAYGEMEADISNQKIDKYKTPASRQHWLWIINANVPGGEQLQKALEECMKQDGDVTPDNQHKNNAMCGEIVAAYTWLLNHQGQDLKSKSPQPVVVAWNGKSKKVVDPCSTNKPNESEWGCNEFVGIKGLNFNVADKKAQLEDYDCIVKGAAQQQLPNLTRQRSQGGKPKREEEEEEKEEKRNIHALVFKACG